MPARKFILVLVSVIASAGISLSAALWIGTRIQATVFGIAGLLPLVLIGTVLVWVIQMRLRKGVRLHDTTDR